MIFKSKKNKQCEKDIQTFPYEDLLFVNPLDVYTQEKCLRKLIQFGEDQIFFENSKNLKIVVEFLHTNLISCNDKNYSESIISSQLFMLRLIVQNLKPDELFYVIEMDTLFAIVNHLVPLKSFSEFSAKIILEILIAVLGPLKEVPEKAMNCLFAIRKKLQKAESWAELAQLCVFVFQKFPHENCGLFIWCAQWIMTKMVDMLSTDEKDENSIKLKSTLLAATLDFIHRISPEFSRSNSLGPFLTDGWKKFIKNLTRMTDKIVELCGDRTTASHAKNILALVLANFMQEKQIFNQQTSSILKKDIKTGLRLRISSWPSEANASFFWICHLLLRNDRYLWSPKQILKALSDLIFSKNKLILTAEILKSVCYIYPNVVRKHKLERTTFLGEQILTYIEHFSNIAISKVLSFDLHQLIWILFSGSQELKESTLKWWLMQSNAVPTEVKNLMKTQELQPLILDILIKNEDHNEEFAVLNERCIELIQEFQNSFMSNQIQNYLRKNSTYDLLLFTKLIKTRPKVPNDENAAAILLKIACYFLPLIVEEDSFRENSRFVRYLLKALQESKEIEPVCKNDFILKFLVAKLLQNIEREKMVIEIIKVLKVLVLCQVKRNILLDSTIILDLTLLLEKASDQQQTYYLDLFYEVAASNSFSSLKSSDHVTNLALIFINLGSVPNHSTKSNFSLVKLLKSHHWLAEMSIFRFFLEQRCFFLGRSTSLSFLKLIFVWINLMMDPQRRTNVILPKRKILESYMLRCKLKPKFVHTYLLRLDEIYT